jgi:O-6-methylguanine DNA methyltransferase
MTDNNSLSHQPSANRTTVYYNHPPFHLSLELDDGVVTRISFLAPEDAGRQQRTSEHPFIDAIEKYLDGATPELVLPHRLDVTDFAAKVYEATLAIPKGRTATYSQIAAQIGKPKASRAVGAALASNPLPLIIPCHRVIGAGGRLTGFAGGLDVKRLLLALEEGK